MTTEHRCSIAPENFQPIVSSSMDGFLLVDMEGTILEANESYCQLTGYQRDQLIGMHMSSLDAIDSHEAVARRVAAIKESGSLRFESRHRHKDGSVIDVEVSVNYSASLGGSFFSFIRDVTSQKHIREIMEARLRLIEFSLTHSLGELLRRTLDEAEALTGSCIGFYHFKDPDSQMLTLQAWSTKTATTFCKAEGSGSHYPVSQAGVWVDCIRERRPVIHNDYASLPHKKGMPDGHAAVIRELVVPIFRHDKIVAIMGVGNKSSDYTQQDVEVISKLADLAWDVAVRKKIEEELRTSEERYRNIVEHQTEFVDRYQPGGVLTYVNGSLVRFTGLPADELLGKSFYPFLHEDDREETIRLIESISKCNPVVNTENRVVLPNGKIRWNRWTHTGLFDENGAVIEYQSVGRDITDQKLADIALQKSEAILRSSQILAKVGGWEWDVVLQAMTWTEETYRIHDIEPSSVMPGSAELIEISLNCYDPEGRPVIREAFKRCIEQGESYDMEFPFTSTIGRKLWIRTTALPEWDDNRVVRVIGNIMDITERKNLEYQLAKHADFNMRVFNSLDSNMAVIDNNGMILSVNEAWSDFARNNLGDDASKWGVGADYFVKYDRKWGDTEQAQEAFDGVRKVQNGELQHFSMEYPCHGSGNEKRWFVLNVLPLIGNDGSVLLSHTNITERKLAQDGLKEAEWKFRALFENGPVGVAYHSMIYDDSGKAVDYFFIDANENYINLTGVDPRGKTVLQAFPGIENDPFDWIGTFGNVARTGETIHFEQYLQANDRWYDVVGYQYKPDHFVASFIEITERKKAEKYLRREQSMLARTESISHIGSWEWDVATENVTWSDELFRIFQLDPADGAPSIEDQSRIYDPEDMKELLRVIGISVSDGTPYEMESRITRPNGEIRICLARGFAERNQEGKVIRLFGSFQDITESKEIEAALKKLEHRQAKMIENISDVIVIIDQDGINRYKSPNIEKWFGWKPEELVGANAFDNIHPDDLATGLEFVGNLLKTPGATGTTECRYRCKDGSYKWIEITLINLVDDPDIRGILGDYHDISERKRFEEEKKFLEQQFQQAQKLESLGVLAGGIAHDFNNILAIIIGHCSLADMNPDRAREHIPTIEKAADRAAGLCRQMLTYAGKATFSLTKVNIAALIAEMVQMLRATISQNIVIKSDFSTDIPAINADASQLRQITMNLIINASEAIGDVQGVIHVSLTKRAVKAGQAADQLGKAIPSGWYACLEVSDTGCGMDDETKRRIFEPFYTTKFTGRGLGMSAVLGIIKAHNGALQLISQPGHGTTFTIYLPFETGEQTASEPSEQTTSTPWQGSGTVLLVEDEDQVKLVAKAMLEELGFKVLEASNGREALDLYHNSAPDISLVLTDIGMPIMDGYTLFRELKTLDPKLRIIISSGFGDTVVTTRIPAEEIAGLVSKPYQFDQLRDVLMRVVEGSQKQG